MLRGYGVIDNEWNHITNLQSFEKTDKHGGTKMELYNPQQNIWIAHSDTP